MKLQVVVDRAARRYLKLLLRRTGGDVTQVARIAGMNRTAIYRAMDRLGIERRRYEPKPWDREIKEDLDAQPPRYVRLPVARFGA